MNDVLEQLQFISNIYKDPYCICDLYSKDGITYRAFRISNELVRKHIITILMDNQMSYGIYGEQLYIVVPYVKGVNLIQWKQERHSMIERIAICKQILFHYLSLPYDDQLLALCLDANTISIENETIDFFQHPNFAVFLREEKREAMPQRMAQLCYEVLEEDSSIHKQNYLKNPKEFQMFSHKLIWKRYRTYDQIMSDLTTLENAYRFHQDKKKALWKYGVIIAALVVILLLLLFGFLKWREQNAKTYEGIQQIGNELLSP